MAEEKAKKTNRVVRFFKDLKRELKNIVWSPKKDVMKNTTVVVVVTAISAVVIMLLDTGLTKVLDLLVNLFK
ncbi:MAG: preprotein translocase subunit SecE [Clostridia bacterium]|nr:preprotein translocase subunit SecE [Clostridia bacterium]